MGGNHKAGWHGVCAAFVLSPAALLVGPANESLAQSATLDEIVVTAQKREQGLQDVPVAVTALTGDALEARNITDLADIGDITPGLSFESIGLRSPFIFMRGTGTGAFDIGSDGSVSVFVDELYMPRFTGMQLDLADIERIEVLKGPQGTLFGRNTAGGAISVVSRKPTDDFTARALLDIGNKDYVSFRGSLSGPLVEDRLLARMSVAGKRRDGWVENTITGEDHLDSEAFGMRGQLLFRGDSAEALLSATYTRDDAGASAFQNKTNSVFLLSPFSPFAGSVPSSTDPERQAYDTDGFQDREGIILSGKLDWDLGFANFTSITGYISHEFDELHDLDGTEAAVINRAADEESDSFSQEVRLTSNDDGRWDWIVGGYFFKDDASRQETFTVGPDSGLSAVFAGGGTFTVDDWVTVDTQSWAVFGQVGFQFTDELKINAGLRYSEDRKEEFRTTDRSVASPLLFVPYTVTPEADWESVDPQASLQYTPTDDLMFYASYSEGFKSGGFQPAVPASAAFAQSVFNPEDVRSYEIGMKSDLLDNRLRLNLAAFHVRYSDLQFLAGTGSLGAAPIVVITNAAESTTDGVEVELEALITENLRLTAGYAYLDATFDEYVDGNGVNQAGNQIIRTPEHQAHATATYTVPLPKGRVNIAGDVKVQSRTFFDPDNTVALSQPGYTLYGARLGYESEEGDWKVTAWGRNLGDKAHCANVIALSASTVGLCTIDALRSYGVSLSYAFN